MNRIKEIWPLAKLDKTCRTMAMAAMETALVLGDKNPLDMTSGGCTSEDLVEIVPRGFARLLGIYRNEKDVKSWLVKHPDFFLGTYSEVLIEYGNAVAGRKNSTPARKSPQKESEVSLKKCPKCSRRIDTWCDNSCGTVVCFHHRKNLEFHMVDGKICKGHEPTCGDDLLSDESPSSALSSTSSKNIGSCPECNKPYVTFCSCGALVCLGHEATTDYHLVDGKLQEGHYSPHDTVSRPPFSPCPVCGTVCDEQCKNDCGTFTCSACWTQRKKSVSFYFTKISDMGAMKTTGGHNPRCGEDMAAKKRDVDVDREVEDEVDEDDIDD
jgi:hypothetical protein